jgi:predicted RNA polymerase sigma factor
MFIPQAKAMSPDLAGVNCRLAEARSEFKAAATLTRNARERAAVNVRAEACVRAPGPSR